MLPTLTRYREQGRELPVLLWRPDRPRYSVGSAALGGGIGIRQWVVSLTVPSGYHREDPQTHLAEVAASLDLSGPGVGLMTAADVTERVSRSERGVVVTATVGLGTIGWAAAPDDDLRYEPRSRYAPGTINIVTWLPARLGDAALVNAVATATEAKSQALWELGVEATGTATDAIVILCPLDGPAAPYGGPRSAWGAPLARAVREAVLAGAAAELRHPGA